MQVHTYTGEALRGFTGDATALEAVHHRARGAAACPVSPPGAAGVATVVGGPGRPHVDRRRVGGPGDAGAGTVIGYVDALRSRAWHRGRLTDAATVGDRHRPARPARATPASLLAAHPVDRDGRLGKLAVVPGARSRPRAAARAPGPPATVRRHAAVRKNGVLRADGAAPIEIVRECPHCARDRGVLVLIRPARSKHDRGSRDGSLRPRRCCSSAAGDASGRDAGTRCRAIARVAAIDALTPPRADGGSGSRLVGARGQRRPPNRTTRSSLWGGTRARRVRRRAPSGDRPGHAHVGSREPVADSVLETDKQRNRRVTIRVLPAAAPESDA